MSESYLPAQRRTSTPLPDIYTILRMSAAAIRTITLDALEPHAQAGVSVRRMIRHGDSSRHDHVFHELVYIEAGSAQHETAVGCHELHAGDLIVIRPHVWHAYRNTHKLTLLNCLFDERLPRRFADLLRSVPGAFELYRRRGPRPWAQPPIVLHCGARQRSALLQRFEAIMSEQDQHEPGWELAATSGLLDILLITARLWSRQETSSRVELPPRAEQAVFDAALYLEQHYTAAVNLTDLARRVHLSRWHLSRCFTQHMGIGVVEFVHRLRIEQACRRLRLTDDPISLIALDVGYPEIAYFTRCFRKHLNQTPRTYRRANRADPRRV